MHARVLLLILGLWCQASLASALTVEPNPVLVNATFRGGLVRVSGTTEPGSLVFVAITGSRVEEKLNRKGRLGPLWANVGSLRFSGAPRLCLVASSQPVPKNLDPQILAQHPLDLEAVVRQSKVEPATDVALMQREYLRLKKAQGVYGQFVGAVKVTPSGEQATYTASIPWPDKASAGEYAVEVVHLKQGAVIAHEKATLEVKLVGLPGFISHLAFQKSALYGILSVVIALSVGFVTGLVFKKSVSH